VSGEARHPLDWALLVDYWAADLAPEVEAGVEEHLMACVECTSASARVAAFSEALRSAIPPVISPEHVASLAARGLRITGNDMQPGERREVVFPSGADVLLHRLGGLSLAAAERVNFRMLVERTGEVLVTQHEVPFEREAGRVLVACQKHYAAMPPDTVAEVTVHGAGDSQHVSTYTILHRFD
jgi:predicted dinucleotide-utilizing enzyme